MIITQLNGGLGNQMFQYAVGRALACLRNDDLKLDISLYTSNLQRSYRLNIFNITEAIASKRDLTPFRRRQPLKTVMALFNKHKFTVINEYDPFKIDTRVFEIEGNLFLRGYWQNPKYFESITSILREEFTLTDDVSQQTQALAQTIRDTNMVSLHIRRGDYVSDPKVKQSHGINLESYYRAAIEIVEEQVLSPHFFVFSDEPEWAEHNLPLAHPKTVVTHNRNEREYEDMYLMSQCRYHIIANSSFSWWGAWLSQLPNKLVIAPKIWLRSTQYDTTEVTPPDWLRL